MTLQTQTGLGVTRQTGSKTDPVDMIFDYNLIQKSIKTYKSHWNVKDFDCLFIKSLQVQNTWIM
jgi:hypothetical protein